MIRMGQHLLVLARTDSSARPQDSFNRLDLCEWIRYTGSEWLATARARHIELELIAPDHPVWIDGDNVLLGELLGNLIDNALRYGVGATDPKSVVSGPSASVRVDLGGRRIIQQKKIESEHRRSRVSTTTGKN